MDKIYVAQTRNTGKGVFASKNIKKDESIFTFLGELLKERALKLKCTLQVGPNLWINPYKGSFGRYINHSCNPNAGIKDKNKIVAMRDIRTGEEVTIDYSITDNDPLWKMKCGCGNKNCRRIIRSIPFLPEGLFNNYKSFIPRFLKISYLKEKK